MIVSIILLAILSIGAVSAVEDESGDLQAEDSMDITSSADGQVIYVSVTGNDSGSGDEGSPYATINKAISEVNASQNAVIYLGPGTFIGENNVDLQVKINNKDANTSLTFVGSPNGGTIIDGGDESPIFKSISADSIVNFVNITFTHGKSDMGSAIRSSGALTIENCVFTENDVTNLAAVYMDAAADLTIKNSKFINNTGKQMVDIYFSQNALITLVNNVFDGATATSTYSYSPSCSIQTGKSIVKGNTFKNLEGSYYAGALHMTYNNGDNIANITDNTFVNCTFTGTNGAVLFFQNAYLKNNNFINCSSTTSLLYSNTDFNAFVTFEDAEITGTSFTLKAIVTDDVGNVVKNAKVVFNLDGKNVGSAVASGNDGVASVSVKKLLENGEYVITGTQAYNNANPFDVTVVNGTATVNFDHSPAEVWVSPNGDDTAGDGSKENPFLTLKHALDNGTASSVDLTVHMMDGIYNGSSNRELSYSNVGKVTIIGESYGNVVIDAQKSGNLFTFGQYMEVTLINLTLTNSNSNAVNAYTLTMKDCMVTNSNYVRVPSGGDGALFDNVIFDNMVQINVYNTDFYNCEFKNSNAGTSTGLLWLATNNGLPAKLINNTFFNNTVAGNSGGAAYYVQCDLVSINNTFDSNTVTGTSAAYVAYASGNKITSINDKFINNNVTKYVVQYRGNNNPEIIVENITVINNFASGNGAGLSTNGAKIKGGKFINNTALGNGGAINLLSNSKTADVCDMSIEDVIFENNKAAMGNDIFIEAPTSASYVFANLNNLTITANDLNVTELSDILTVSVTHPSGAIIGGGEVTFYFDGNIIGKSSLVNGNATLEYVGFKNNTVYAFSALYGYANENDTYVNGTVRTNITSALDSIELYVSDLNGSDENGNGSIDNPFKSISKALSQGYKISTNITVHVLEGTYSGNLNTNLRIPTTVDVLLAGEGVNKTIITDSTADYFITALAGNSKLTLSNMTVNRAARDTQSAIYVEEGANVEIDNVAFIGGQGNYGGAINSLGNLLINNSYFFDNGYFDISKRANAYYGGAIYNDGLLIIDNTTFEGNHAGRLSTISNQGTLYMSNSYVIDSVNAYAMNMDLVAIGAFGGQKGHMTFFNTVFKVTNRTIQEVIGEHVYNIANSLICLGIGSCEDVTVINSTFVNEGTRFSPYVFGGINSWNLASGGYTLVPGDVYVYNSTFSNVQAVNVFYSRIDGMSYHSQRMFDGCLFDNVEYLIADLNNGNFSISISNSVILGENVAKIGIASGKTIDMDISNNWWGTNNATYDAATIGTTNFISNYVLKLKENSGHIVNPENYLILTLDATNDTGLIQEVTLAFKSFDGENATDYDGVLCPVREFTMSATNGTLEITNGTIGNKVVSSFEGTEGEGYFVEASVDGVTLNATVEDKLAIGNATILAEDIEMYYGYTQVNVTVLDGTNPATVGKITLKVNGKEYTVEIDNGTATFDIEVLPYGEYDLDYIINDTEVFNPTTNSSKLNIVPYVVTNETFEEFFDENGNLKDTFKGYEMTFEGTISDKGISTINIDQPVVLNGSNATLVGFGINVTDDDVTIEGFTINMTGNFAIVADNADNLLISENTINYVGNTTGSEINNAIRVSNSENVVVENNVLDISIPSAYVPWAEIPAGSGNWVSSPVSEGIVFDNCSELILAGNDIAVEYNSVVGAWDTIYAVDVKNSPNALVVNNNIDANGHSYIYGLIISGENFTVSNNNISVESDSNYANSIDVEGLASGVVENNNITTTSPGVVYAIYSAMSNGDVNVDYINNTIIADSNSVYGMDLGGNEATVSGNALYLDGNYTTGIDSSVNELIAKDNVINANGLMNGSAKNIGIIAAGNATITNNNITTSGEYAVDVMGCDEAKVDENYLVADVFTGNAAVNYDLESAIVTNNVPKMEKTILLGDDIVMYYKNGTRYAVTLMDALGNVLANQNVVITINGIPYTKVTDENGVASLGIGLGSGNYTVTASYTGVGSLTNATIQNSVTVLSTVFGDDLVKVYRNASQYEASFVDGQGNALANTEVQFNINGVMYKKITDENGIAKLNINLAQGTYIITATNPVNGEMHANNITVLPRIVENNDITKFYKNDTQYTVKLIGDDGNPVGAGEVVTFNINGVFYNRTTNASGEAKLNINLPPGDYVITADYKGCKVSNNIKVLPVLSAKDITMKYRDGTQFVATLVDGQGKPYSNQTVTFNINGVFYNKVTDSEGKAKLNINLMPGEYIITSSYNGANIANTIKITS